MARTGRPPKPLEQKIRTGNPGKRALANGSELVALEALPLEAHDLTPQQAFDWIMEVGIAWVGTSEAPMVALTRDALEHYGQLNAAPGTPAKELREARKEIRELLVELGLSTAARSRLQLAAVKAESAAEKLAKLRDR